MAQDAKLVEKMLKSEKSRKAGVNYDAQEFAQRHKNEWIDSSTIKNCSKCAKAFTMTNRKHHCRDCGNVFCAKCSDNKLVINGVLKRVSIIFMIFALLFLRNVIDVQACVDCYQTVMRGGLAGDGSSRASIVDVIPPRMPPLTSSVSASTEVSATKEKRSGSFTGSVNSDRSSNEGGGSGRVSWVEALLLIKKATGKKPTVNAMYPKQVSHQFHLIDFLFRIC
jgi:hypothetical protein